MVSPSFRSCLRANDGEDYAARTCQLHHLTFSIAGFVSCNVSLLLLSYAYVLAARTCIGGGGGRRRLISLSFYQFLPSGFYKFFLTSCCASGIYHVMESSSLLKATIARTQRGGLFEWIRTTTLVSFFIERCFTSCFFGGGSVSISSKDTGATACWRRQSFRICHYHRF